MFSCEFCKFLRTPFFGNHLCWLLLKTYRHFRTVRFPLSFFFQIQMSNVSSKKKEIVIGRESFIKKKNVGKMFVSSKRKVQRRILYPIKVINGKAFIDQVTLVERRLANKKSLQRMMSTTMFICNLQLFLYAQHVFLSILKR